MPQPKKGKQVEFPQFPQDQMSLAHLQALQLLGAKILGNATSKNQHRHGLFLTTIGTCPIHFDFLYFKLWEALFPLHTKYQDKYNELTRKGQGPRLEALDSAIGDMEIYFNDIQLLFFPISQQYANPKNKAWQPIGTIMWTYFMSLFYKEWNKEFMDTVFATVKEMAPPDIKKAMEQNEQASFGFNTSKSSPFTA